MRNTLPSLILLLILSSCGIKPVTINTIRPADVAVNSEIKTILLLDRTKVEKDNWLAIGEAILTGELPYEDRAAAQEALNSLKNKLQESPRFQVRIAAERMAGNSLSSAFPDPIPWEVQKQLLRQYQADALVTIEIMDTDFIVTDGKRKVKRTVGSGDNRKEIEVDEYYAEGVGNIKLGFRFYDPESREIIDQQLLNETNTWSAAADSKAQAAAQLISKSRATQELCKAVGEDYAFKIAPLPVQLVRNFYTKSKESVALEQGARMAEVNDWENAIEVWEAGIKNATREKDKGRMAHNIAVAHEVLGNFDQALQWAQNAYSLYGNKKARSYVGLLESRLVQEQRLQQQMR